MKMFISNKIKAEKNEILLSESHKFDTILNGIESMVTWEKCRHSANFTSVRIHTFT